MRNGWRSSLSPDGNATSGAMSGDMRRWLSTFSQSPDTLREIQANHRCYAAMHAELHASLRGIRCNFFAAAACVTHPRGGLGVLDGAWAPAVIDPQGAAFLRHVHGVLAALNRGWFERLLAGVEVEGCAGLRGRGLDHALVALEQSAFSRVMQAYFGEDAARQARVMGGINLALRRNPLLRIPLMPRSLRVALRVARRGRQLDLCDEAQRCAIGQMLVDIIAAEAAARSNRPVARQVPRPMLQPEKRSGDLSCACRIVSCQAGRGDDATSAACDARMRSW